MKALTLIIICFLIYSNFFISCKKENPGHGLSSQDSRPGLPLDYKFDTTISYREAPPMFGPFISRRTFYLPILTKINTRHLRVAARYNDHPYFDLPDGTSRYTWGGDYLTVYILIPEHHVAEISVRITT